MERKFLEELGLDKEAIDKIMAQHGKDIETHRATAETTAKDRDAYKGQLDDVSKKLKTFEGVDVEALRGEVDTLKKDMATKEAGFQSQLADRDFQALLTANGNNGLVKTKYVTFGIEADNPRIAKHRLERMQTDIRANFKRIDVAFESMNGQERLQQKHVQYRAVSIHQAQSQAG